MEKVLKTITEDEYKKMHKDYKGKIDGKRSIIALVKGATTLLIEGETLKIMK